MELWNEDAEFRGAVCPVFYSRSGRGPTGTVRVSAGSRKDHGRRVLRRMPPLSSAASEFCAEINVLQVRAKYGTNVPRCRQVGEPVPDMKSAIFGHP